MGDNVEMHGTALVRVQDVVARVEQASELMAAVHTKSPGRSWLLGRGGAALAVRPANRLVRIDGQVRVNGASSNASPPYPREGILPLGGTVSDEFAVRLAAWLADVAMNGQRTA